MANTTQNTIARIALTFLSLLFLGNVFASGENDHDKEPFNAGEMIIHHVSDAHEIHLIGHTSIPLPIILWDEGLKVFSSSHFYHGEQKHMTTPDGEEVHYASHDGYIMTHEHIYKGDAPVYEKVEKKEGDVGPDTYAIANAKPFDLSITKSVAGMLFVLALMCFLFLRVARKYSKNPNQAPSGSQGLLEPLILFIRDEVAIPNIGKKKAHKFMPFLLTTFFFIWLCNLLGLVPFVGGFNITGTLSITAVLAFIVFVITTVNGNKHYWSHILWPAGVPLPIKFILVPVEIVGIFLKPLVLMIRLTANITAGHIIILAFVSLVLIFGEQSQVAGYGVGVGAVLFMVFMFFIELLVAFLQAYVFTLLAAIYFGDATDEGHH